MQQSMPQGLTQEQLKQWLLQSGREFIVFNSLDFVDALPWPAGVEMLQQLIAAYAQHRRAMQPSKPETLSGDELHAIQTWIEAQIRRAAQ